MCHAHHVAARVIDLQLICHTCENDCRAMLKCKILHKRNLYIAFLLLRDMGYVIGYVNLLMVGGSSRHGRICD